MFILHDDGKVFDYELNHLREQLALYDQRYLVSIEALQSEVEWEVEYAMDQMEYIVGSAFVECQTYITSTYGPILSMGRGDALKVGREVASNLTVAALINHAANYWKHKDEWKDPPHWKTPQWNINRAFDAIGIDLFNPSGFAAHRVFEKIAGDSTPSLGILADVLMEWRDTLIEREFHTQNPATT